ncbi:hypothetical protein [Pseudonocardia nigra]|uniref:hypothetical protein n=1 Tax=Pseudonocardia nigra TaxID=1921578 RepID=UPI001FEBD13C|nr:hypothetical protein [Pseudonocardia nigra]
MTDIAHDDQFPAYEAAAPSDAVRALDRLVGTWRVTGGAEGKVTYEWMEGGHFLLQRVALEQYGQRITGLEVIGHLRPFGEGASADMHSRFYDAAGNTFDYVYELEGDTLHIWAGAKGSAAKFTGTFDEGDQVMAGEWVYPGGGGYPSTMTRTAG